MPIVALSVCGELYGGCSCSALVQLKECFSFDSKCNSALFGGLSGRLFYAVLGVAIFCIFSIVFVVEQPLTNSIIFTSPPRAKVSLAPTIVSSV